LQVSSTVRTGPGQWWSEVVATFGLVLVVVACRGQPPSRAPIAVGAYIAAAYWFTASTSFANPAVTLARGFTATFSGVEPSGIAAFMLAQLVGALLALAAAAVLDPERAAG
ncbi:MAG TPA: aquaporin family protein, partial [Burkholderiales bacterium]|nr:aquaporin family protein [Burkholderiales bacterium]